MKKVIVLNKYVCLADVETSFVIPSKGSLIV